MPYGKVDGTEGGKVISNGKGGGRGGGWRFSMQVEEVSTTSHLSSSSSSARQQMLQFTISVGPFQVLEAILAPATGLDG